MILAGITVPSRTLGGAGVVWVIKIWNVVKESSLSKIHPIYRPNTIRNTSIDVVPPKRNIFDKTIVDIGSTHMGVPYETIKW